MVEFGTGGCLCGEIRFFCNEKPLMAGLCHCRDCQTNTGTAFGTLIIFSKSAVTVRGDSIGVYESKGDSGKNVRRRFCRNCGTPYMVEYEVTPNFRVILGGTLDDPSLVKPEWNIYTSSKQPWLELSKDLKCFDRGFER